MGKAEGAARRPLPPSSKSVKWQDLKNAEAQRKANLKHQIRAEISIVKGELRSTPLGRPLPPPENPA
jgi:hypothetical protein